MNSAAHLMQMQKQAAERVKQQQELSRRLVREHPVNVDRGVPFSPLCAQEKQEKNTVPCPCEAQPASPCSCETQPTSQPLCVAKDEPCGLFAGDNEQLLLLLLAAVLAKNGAPLPLLLALLYVRHGGRCRYSAPPLHTRWCEKFLRVVWSVRVPDRCGGYQTFRAGL